MCLLTSADESLTCEVNRQRCLVVEAAAEEAGDSSEAYHHSSEAPQVAPHRQAARQVCHIILIFSAVFNMYLLISKYLVLVDCASGIFLFSSLP